MPKPDFLSTALDTISMGRVPPAPLLEKLTKDEKIFIIRKLSELLINHTAGIKIEVPVV